MALSSEEKIFLLMLCSKDVFGFQALNSLYFQYNSFKSIFESNPTDWISISPAVKQKWIKQKKEGNIEKVIPQIQRAEIQYVTLYDDEYPALLKEISSPPILLYYQGDLSITATLSLGVVGTRMISAYGKSVVEKILPDLVSEGIIITSGFQRGVDQVAHWVTLQNNGKTIAVVGTGLDVDYPANSGQLRKSIIDKGGLILSEYPLGTAAFKANFPRRNRIISGLSKGVLVVEAALKSGSLITARFANEQNREVFAIPGSIFSTLSYGPHHLIQQGAKCVHSARDILEELQLQPSILKKQSPSFPSETHHIIYEALALRPHSIDELIEKYNLSIEDISSCLTDMEIEGFVSNMGDGTYIVS